MSCQAMVGATAAGPDQAVVGSVCCWTVVMRVEYVCGSVLWPWSAVSIAGWIPLVRDGCGWAVSTNVAADVGHGGVRRIRQQILAPANIDSECTTRVWHRAVSMIVIGSTVNVTRVEVVRSKNRSMG